MSRRFLCRSCLSCNSLITTRRYHERRDATFRKINRHSLPAIRRIMQISFLRRVEYSHQKFRPATGRVILKLIVALRRTRVAHSCNYSTPSRPALVPFDAFSSCIRGENVMMKITFELYSSELDDPSNM